MQNGPISFPADAVVSWKLRKACLAALDSSKLSHLNASKDSRFFFNRFSLHFECKNYTESAMRLHALRRRCHRPSKGFGERSPVEKKEDLGVFDHNNVSY